MKEVIEETLDDASAMLERGSYRSAIDRAYYAMFYTAQHYLKVRHFDETKHLKTHNGTQTKFYQLAVRTDGLDEGLGGAFARIGNDRTDFDYGLAETPDRTDATDAVSTARWFCRTVLADLDRTS